MNKKPVWKITFDSPHSEAPVYILAQLLEDAIELFDKINSEDLTGEKDIIGGLKSRITAVECIGTCYWY